MKKITLLFLITIIFFMEGCSKKEAVESVIDNSTSSEELTEKNEIIETEISEDNIPYEGELHEEITEYIGEIITKGNGSKLFETKTKGENIEIRKFPTEESSLVYTTYDNLSYTVAGFSDNKESIEGEEGYWFFVYGNDEESQGKSGWIFSKNLIVSKYDKVSTITYVSENFDTNQNLFTSINISLNRDSYAAENIETSVQVKKGSSDNLYFFKWNDSNSDFFYSDPVGLFSWNSETKEIKHVSYHSTEGDTKWAIMTEDSAFLIEDSSLNSTISEFNIFDASNDEIVFSGEYYNDIELSGHEITILLNPEIGNYLLTDEMKEAFENFNSIPYNENEQFAVDNDMNLRTVVRCRYDFGENIATYLDCIRIILP